MAYLPLFYALSVVVAFFLHLMVKSFATRRRRAALAKKWGCKPAPFDIFSDRWGILNVMRIQSADKRRECPDHYHDRFVKNSEHYGRVVSTVAGRIFGDDSYITCDPKNIQALLATQFKDFGL